MSSNGRQRCRISDENMISCSRLATCRVSIEGGKPIPVCDRCLERIMIKQVGRDVERLELEAERTSTRVLRLDVGETIEAHWRGRDGSVTVITYTKETT